MPNPLPDQSEPHDGCIDRSCECVREAGDALARAVRGLDSYAALGGAPMERTERADAALAEWDRLTSDEERR